MLVNDRSYERKLKFHFLQLSLLEYEDDGTLDQTSIIPMVDGGTEGTKTLLGIIEDLFGFSFLLNVAFSVFHESLKTTTAR